MRYISNVSIRIYVTDGKTVTYGSLSDLEERFWPVTFHAVPADGQVNLDAFKIEHYLYFGTLNIISFTKITCS